MRKEELNQSEGHSIISILTAQCLLSIKTPSHALRLCFSRSQTCRNCNRHTCARVTQHVACSPSIFHASNATSLRALPVSSTAQTGYTPFRRRSSGHDLQVLIFSSNIAGKRPSALPRDQLAPSVNVSTCNASIYRGGYLQLPAPVPRSEPGRKEPIQRRPRRQRALQKSMGRK